MMSITTKCISVVVTLFALFGSTQGYNCNPPVTMSGCDSPCSTCAGTIFAGARQYCCSCINGYDFDSVNNVCNVCTNNPNCEEFDADVCNCATCNPGYSGISCIQIKCPAKNYTSNGGYASFPSTWETQSPPTFATYSCSGAYSGSITQSCNNGTWTYVNGSCTFGCNATSYTSNGALVSFPASASGVISESCPTGYYGNITQTCNSGSWAYSTGSCSAINCPATIYTNNGYDVTFSSMWETTTVVVRLVVSGAKLLSD